MRLILCLILNVCATFAAYAASDPITAPAEFNYKAQDTAFWKKHLPADVYAICRDSGTELPGSGQYDHFYKDGTYYCACCGGDFALYSSTTKFNSGTGWPSFYAPLPNAVVEQADSNDSLIGSLVGPRTEVLCRRCGSHLGHVFNDGPPPTGKRYCMNSLTLVFVAKGEKPKRTYSVK